MNTQIYTRRKPSSAATFFRLSLFSALCLSALLLSACSNDAIFSAIEKEVKLKDASVSGTVTSMLKYGSDLYATTGYLYKRTLGSGTWNKMANPSGAYRCSYIATDGTYLFGLFTNEDWTSFNSLQFWDGSTWTKVTGFTNVTKISNGNGMIFAVADPDETYTTYNVYAVAVSGSGPYTIASTEIIPVSGTSTILPVGSAAGPTASTNYFATSTTVYVCSSASATALSSTNGPTAGIAGIATNGSDLYAVDQSYAYHYSGSAWSATKQAMGVTTPVTGVAVLDTTSTHSNTTAKKLLLISCRYGYREVPIDATTKELGTYFAPGANASSSVRTADQDQYDSTLQLWLVSSIYVFTDPVPTGDDYVVYANIMYPKYIELWGYYSNTQTEWNRE